MKKLDRSKYFSTVFGDSVARFYQGGCYFDASGLEVSEEAAGMDGDSGHVMVEQQRALESENAARQQDLDSVNEAAARAQEHPQEPAEEAREEEPKDPEPNMDPEMAQLDAAESADELRAMADALHYSKINTLLEIGGVTPVTGEGSKDKNIEQLVKLKFPDPAP